VSIIGVFVAAAPVGFVGFSAFVAWAACAAPLDAGAAAAAGVVDFFFAGVVGSFVGGFVCFSCFAALPDSLFFALAMESDLSVLYCFTSREGL